MRQDYKIIKEEYNTDTLLSTVTIQTDIGIFTGYSKAYDYDCKYSSIHHGHQIALTKALQKFVKKTITLLNKDIALIEKMKKEIRDNNSFEAGIIHNYLKNKQIELTQWCNRQENLGKSLQERLKSRDAILERYEKKN